MRITRHGRDVLACADVEAALRLGRAIDQLGLQAGDRLFVPRWDRGLGAAEGPLRALSISVEHPPR